MSLDLTKYRTVFIEEATEHLSEMSNALLELEKEVTDAEAIDLIFRMAHGIKGMAASLEYVPITEVAHHLEDRVSAIRDAGAVRAGTGSRGLVILVNWAVIGVIGGALVLVTGGIAAAFVGHAITRFAFFMTMGPPRRAALEQVAPRTGGTGDRGAYVIPPRDYRRG